MNETLGRGRNTGEPGLAAHVLAGSYQILTAAERNLVPHCLSNERAISV